MKYFFDTEFLEYDRTLDLVSIGIIGEDGNEYYAISSEYDASKANIWVKRNVFRLLESENEVPRKNLKQIKNEIIKFIQNEKSNRPEFWAYFNHYDWICFIWIFGNMHNVPNGYPQNCMDLKQRMIDLSFPDKMKPSKPRKKHNALVDAKWNMEFYNKMEEFKKNL